MEPNKPQKTIRHGNWTFDYGSKNIFNNTFAIDTIDENKFSYLNSVPAEHSKDNCLSNSDIDDFRRASVIHKLARAKALTFLCSGKKLSDLVNAVEELIIKMCKQDINKYYKEVTTQGIAFPVGVNINNVVAHDSKLTTIVDDRIFYKGDVVKVDIGVHVNGRIIDSAFTHIVTDKAGVHDKDNIYNSVLEASRDSMFSAIKMLGSDQLITDMSETISDIIKSYEVDMGDGISLPIKPVQGIGGHNIKQYQIHGGKLILSSPNYNIQKDQRIEEDEIYAIETYATTGYGVMTQNDEMDNCTHYMEPLHRDVESNPNISKHDKKAFRKTELYDWLKNRKGLPFSLSWINQGVNIVPGIKKALNIGVPSGQIIAYPPLKDEDGSVVAQFEHTVHVGDNTVEIFSLGTDY
jgi:methionyl aminopeptidase